MKLQPIDYQSVYSLGRKLFGQLSRALREQEAYLAKEVLEALHVPVFDSPLLAPPDVSLIPVMAHQLNLAETLDVFEKRIEQGKRQGHGLPMHKHLPGEWQESLKRVNKALNDHCDLLHETIIELFHLTDHLGFEEYQAELFQLVGSFRKLLKQRLEALAVSIKRLEQLLWAYSESFSTDQKWLTLLARRFGLSHSFLERGMQERITKAMEELDTCFRLFKVKFYGFISLKEKSAAHLHKLDWYQVLHAVDGESQQLYRKIVQLLKMNELKTSGNPFAESDLVWNLRSISSPEQAKFFFRQYLHKLEEALYRTSRVIKLGINDGYRTAQELQEDIEGYRRELATFRETLEGYRHHISKGHHELAKLEDSARNVERLFVQMNIEMVESLSMTPKVKGALASELTGVLREMAQPLVSRERMKGLTLRYIHLLERCGELGTTDLSLFDLVSEALSGGLRADWRYQVLQENKTFHRILERHYRIWGLHGDRAHIKRKNYFLEHFRRIEALLKDQQKPHHDQDILMEINEIKVSLQDFLAHLQRLDSEMGLEPQRALRLINQVSYELLRYRSIFSMFFLHLQRYEMEGELLRRQFLFVDQYFDSMEAKITALKKLQNPASASTWNLE